MNTQISAVSPLARDPRLSAKLWFEVLGPVRAWHDGAELDLGSPQQRGVLAILLLSRGWQVSKDVLIDAIWGADPPRAAPGTVRTYISRLRRCLDPVTGYRATELITSIGDGYALTPDSVTVDADLFARHVADAHQARDQADTATAATRLRAALELWRGMPLAGIQGPYADSQRTRLAELRTAATEDRLAMDIESGRQLAAIAELRTLLDEHPLREKLSELLMLALYRAGRQADALSVFAGTRRLLADELGIDPSPALRDMHERILRADASLAGSGNPGTLAKAQDRPARASEPPAQLPPLHADFTGRADALDAIVTMLKDDAAASPVITITGMPGIGKTALAVHAARAVLDVFPDGQLYAELGAVAGAPVEPVDVLPGFLQALGHSSVPAGLGELIAAGRTAFAGRRMLVVLDDAQGTAQVASLLPALRGCAVIVTSQRHLIGLPGARTFEIAGLRPDESLRLLERFVGERRLAAEPAAASRMVTACAGQPIAIRTAGARLATRPGWRVTAMVDQLEHELTQPVITYPDCALVEAPFDRAHRRLGEAEAFLFRQAATADTPEISAAAAAELMDVPENRAVALLESLTDSHLLEAGAFGAYRYDPLVKLHAWRMALEMDGPQRCAASRELLGRHAPSAAFPPWLPCLTALGFLGPVAAPVGQ